MLLMAALSYVAAAQDKPIITKSLDGAGITFIEAETSGGNIIVTGESNELRAELWAVPNNSKDNSMSAEQIKEKLDNDYEIKFSIEGNRLVAIARRKRKAYNWKNGLSISFKMYVPKKVSSNLTTSGGNIELKGIEGKQDFVTSGGNLVVDDAGGNITGTTSGGNISVQHARDEINMTTSGGNIEVKDCTGRIKLATSGGNISLSGLNGNINAGTSGGNVSAEEITGELKASTSGGNLSLSKLSCMVEAATSGGEIEVSLLQLSGYVRVNNSGGNIRLFLPKGSGADLTITGDRISTETLENFSGKLDKEMIDGKLNGGGAKVAVRAESGNVFLGFK